MGGSHRAKHTQRQGGTGLRQGSRPTGSAAARPLPRRGAAVPRLLLVGCRVARGAAEGTERGAHGLLGTREGSHGSAEPSHTTYGPAHMLQPVPTRGRRQLKHSLTSGGNGNCRRKSQKRLNIYW